MRRAPSIHVDAGFFFFGPFFFFAMTLSMSPLTLKEQWLQRHECDMNGLWRIGASNGEATHQRRNAVDRGGERHLAMSVIGT
jgi:hypothetical protein